MRRLTLASTFLLLAQAAPPPSPGDLDAMARKISEAGGRGQLALAGAVADQNMAMLRQACVSLRASAQQLHAVDRELDAVQQALDTGASSFAASGASATTAGNTGVGAWLTSQGDDDRLMGARLATVRAEAAGQANMSDTIARASCPPAGVAGDVPPASSGEAPDAAR